jgi:hypothetical protein
MHRVIPKQEAAMSDEYENVEALEGDDIVEADLGDGSKQGSRTINVNE